MRIFLGANLFGKLVSIGICFILGTVNYRPLIPFRKRIFFH